MSDNCPVCNLELKEIRPDSYCDNYDCYRCGKFEMDNRRAVEDLQQIYFEANLKGEKEDKIAILSHSIRKMQKKDVNYWPKIDKQLIEAILKQTLPTPLEQKKILIRWLGDNIKSAGKYIRVNKHSILAVIGAKTEDEYHFTVKHLLEDKLIERTTVDPGIEHGIVVCMESFGEITLSLDGWKYYENLKRDGVDSRKAFMAMEHGGNTYNIGGDYVGQDKVGRDKAGRDINTTNNTPDTIEMTKFRRFIRWCENNWIIRVMFIVSIILAGLATAINSCNTINDSLFKSNSSPKSEIDPNTANFK